MHEESILFVCAPCLRYWLVPIKVSNASGFYSRTIASPGIPRNFTQFHTIPRYSTQFYTISRYYTRFRGIPRNGIVQFYGIEERTNIKKVSFQK